MPAIRCQAGKRRAHPTVNATSTTHTTMDKAHTPMLAHAPARGFSIEMGDRGPSLEGCKFQCTLRLTLLRRGHGIRQQELVGTHYQ